MWVIVLFDLPTETEAQKKRYAKFRKELLNDGFRMFQFSIYLRHCPSKENALVHIQRVEKALPPFGHVGILTITDKQFSLMKIFYGKEEKDTPPPTQQLELF